MSDLISRSALARAMGVENAVKYGNETAEQQHNSYDTLMKYEIADYIEDAPAVDAVEVVHARWSTHQECSACGDFARYSAYGEPYYSRYCPNCGAQMDAEDDEHAAD